MFLWIIILAMTAAAVLAVLVPLGRHVSGSVRGDSGQAVYLDQLAELDRERAEGRISPVEANAARAEIARRLIAVETDEDDRGPNLLGPWPRRTTALVALCGIPLLSLSLYGLLGAPFLAGQPLAARLDAPASQTDVALLLRRVEDHLRKAPEDGQGWGIIAPIYLRLARLDDAVSAYRNAIRLLGSSVDRETGLGESLVAAAEGVVTADAKDAFVKAAAADSKAVPARFFLAVAREQDGDRPGAQADLHALLDAAPADAPWRGTVEQELARMDGPADEGPGPSSEQVAAAAGMSAGDRQAMIEGMVGQLAERLKAQPDDVEGWLRLVRAYRVLGNDGAATEAATTAMKTLSDDADRARVGALIADLGLRAAGTGTP